MTVVFTRWELRATLRKECDEEGVALASSLATGSLLDESHEQ